MQNRYGYNEKNSSAVYSQQPMNFSDGDLADTLESFDAQHSDMVALGKVLGPGAVREICQLMGGRKVHVPEFDNLVWQLKRTVRDEEIRAKFRGNNLPELCFEYSMSARHVHRILHGDRKKYLRDHERTKGLRTSGANHARLVELARQYGLAVRQIVDAVIEAGLSSAGLGAALSLAAGQMPQLFASA